MPAGSSAKPQRIASVDALRGFSIFWLLGGEGLMIAVGEMLAQGSLTAPLGNFVSSQFTHPEWVGFRFWDWIFPLLIFVTGTSIVFSLAGMKARGEIGQAYGRIFRRAALLYVLGILFYGGLSKFWPDVRMTGVLQRIAFCYLFAALLFLHLSWRSLAATCAVIVIGYWVLLTFVPVPDTGPASYAPDINIVNWLDRHILPGRTFDPGRDPEGVLSTIPAVATCLFGVLAGILLRDDAATPGQKVKWFVLGGLALTLAGYVWSLQFPFIKPLWTSSFVLVTAGYSLMVLGALYYLMDIRGRQLWATVFIWIGGNALALYFINGITGFEPFARRIAGGDVSKFLDSFFVQGAGAFVRHVIGLAIAIALAAYLYRRRIFIRV